MKNLDPGYFFRGNIKMLQLFGTWPYKANSLPIKTKIPGYVFWQCFTLVTFIFLFNLSSIYTVYQVWGNLNLMISASFLLITHFAQSVKILLFVKNSSRILDLVYSLRNDIFTPRNLTQEMIIRKTIKACSREKFLFGLSTVSTLSMYFAFPFFDNAGRERHLPFFIRYPFNVERTPNFEIMYCYQMTSVTNNGLHNVFTDTLVSGLMKMACAQLSMLRNSVTMIYEDAVIEVGGKNKKKLDERVYEKFKSCVQHHQAIIKFIKELEEVFQYGILAQISAGIFVLCVTGFHLTIIGPTKMEFYAQILYLICMLFEIFLYCGNGNEIMFQSMEVERAVFSCKWYNFNENLKKDLNFFMFCTQKPIIVRVGYFFRLTLEMYVSILKNAYSYFALLQSMDNGN